MQVKVALAEATKEPPPNAALFGYPARFGTALTAADLGPLDIYAPQPADACSPLSAAPGKAAAALVVRGNCSFVDKALAVQNAGYQAMVLYDDGSDTCMVMSLNGTDPAPVSVVAVSITGNAGDILQDLAAAGGSITLSAPDINEAFDLSEALLWAMAVGVVTSGSLWAGRAARTAHRPLTGTDVARTLQEEDGAVITAHAAASFIFVASAALLTMYLFLSDWFAIVLIGLFAFIAWQATAVVLTTGLHRVSSPGLRAATVPWGDPASPMPVLELAGASASAVATVAWLVFRQEHWAWVLQDFLSINLMLFMLRSIHLPNLKVACILLPSALAYDVWWVFIQPRVTGSPSVMVEVATGGGAGVNLPMLLAVPQWNGLGTNPALAVLGLGDVVLPGLLVAFARRWDIAVGELSLNARRRQHGNGTAPLTGTYFWPVVIAYGAGLVITFIALALGVGGSQGQPALLYLVPATLGTMLLLGWLHGDLHGMWACDSTESTRVAAAAAPAGGEDEEEGAALLLDPDAEIQAGP